MTPEQFKQAMSVIHEQSEQRGRDLERLHGEADDLLCKMLEELGYGAGVQLFREMDKFYA